MDDFQREIVEGFARIETKVDLLLKQKEDHEVRIRAIESEHNSCSNDGRVSKLEENQESNTRKIYWGIGAGSTLGFIVAKVIPAASTFM